MTSSIKIQDMKQDRTYMVVSDTIVIDKTLAKSKYGLIRCGKDYATDEHVICKLSKDTYMIEKEAEILRKLNESKFSNYPELIA